MEKIKKIDITDTDFIVTFEPEKDVLYEVTINAQHEFIERNIIKHLSDRLDVKVIKINYYGNRFKVFDNVVYSKDMDEVLYYPNYAEGHVRIREGVAVIAERAFFKSKISSVEFPSTLEVIENLAFSFCNNLKEAVFPKSLIKIEGLAFYACENLERISLNHGLQLIYKRAFACCDKITKVEIPQTVQSLLSESFMDVKEIHFKSNCEGCDLSPSMCENCGLKAEKLIVPAISSEFSEHYCTKVVYDEAIYFIPKSIPQSAIMASNSLSDLSFLSASYENTKLETAFEEYKELKTERSKEYLIEHFFEFCKHRVLDDNEENFSEAFETIPAKREDFIKILELTNNPVLRARILEKANIADRKSEQASNLLI